jgi:hypothetical protein
VQLLTMRREQGRVEELLPTLLSRTEETGGEPLRPTAVLALAHVGRHAEAHARIDPWGWPGRDWSWDFTAAQWAEVAAILGRGRRPGPAGVDRFSGAPRQRELQVTS